MSTIEPFIIATAAASGVALAVPKKYDDALSTLLYVLAAASRIYALYLEQQNQPDATLNANMASIMFGLLGTTKTLGLV